MWSYVNLKTKGYLCQDIAFVNQSPGTSQLKYAYGVSFEHQDRQPQFMGPMQLQSQEGTWGSGVINLWCLCLILHKVLEWVTNPGQFSKSDLRIAMAMDVELPEPS